MKLETDFTRRQAMAMLDILDSAAIYTAAFGFPPAIKTRAAELRKNVDAPRVDYSALLANVRAAFEDIVFNREYDD